MNGAEEIHARTDYCDTQPIADCQIPAAEPRKVYFRLAAQLQTRLDSNRQ